MSQGFDITPTMLRRWCNGVIDIRTEDSASCSWFPAPQEYEHKRDMAASSKRKIELLTRIRGYPIFFGCKGFWVYLFGEYDEDNIIVMTLNDAIL